MKLDTNNLVAWLTAQIDEDERLACAATAGTWVAVPYVYGPPEEGWGEPRDWEVRADGADVVSHQPHEGGGANRPDAEHIARHDPARVLREVQAKRRILVEHRPGVDPCDAHDASLRTITCDTVRLLAGIYADRPGYRDEWKLE